MTDSFVKRFATDTAQVSAETFFKEATEAVMNFELGADKDGKPVTLASLQAERADDRYGRGIDYLVLKPGQNDESRWTDVHLGNAVTIHKLLIECSLTQNNAAVDQRPQFNSLKDTLESYLTNYVLGVRRLAEGGGHSFEASHAVTDVKKYNAVVSITEKIPQMQENLNKVFEKYSVGPYAPAQQKSSAIAA